MKLSITSNFPTVQHQLEQLREEVGNQALQMAMNRTVERARTEMVRAITSEFAIKASDVRAQLGLRKASRGRGPLEASLEAFGRRRGRSSRNVMLFGAKAAPGRTRREVRFKTARGWITRMVPVGGGVTVKIKRTGGRKLIEGAFIGNQGRTVFIRTGSARLPIKPVETIDVPQMFNTRRINVRVIRRIEEVFPVEFERASRVAIERWSRR